MDLPFIKVDGSKLETIKSMIWFKSEEPLFLVPLEYRIESRKKNLRTGYLMVTKGSMYVIKTKFLINNDFNIFYFRNGKDQFNFSFKIS